MTILWNPSNPKVLEEALWISGLHVQGKYLTSSHRTLPGGPNKKHGKQHDFFGGERWGNGLLKVPDSTPECFFSRWDFKTTRGPSFGTWVFLFNWCMFYSLYLFHYFSSLTTNFLAHLALNMSFYHPSRKGSRDLRWCYRRSRLHRERTGHPRDSVICCTRGRCQNWWLGGTAHDHHDLECMCHLVSFADPSRQVSSGTSLGELVAWFSVRCAHGDL